MILQSYYFLLIGFLSLSSSELCSSGEVWNSKDFRCRLVPAGQAVNIDESPVPKECRLSHYPGAAYCRLESYNSCDLGQYDHRHLGCTNIPPGYWSPHSDFFGVYYKCPEHMYSKSDSQSCKPNSSNVWAAPTRHLRGAKGGASDNKRG